MRLRAFAVLVLAALPAIAAAQSPRYVPEFLGPFPAGKINSRGEMVSGIAVGSATRALVVRAGAPHELLPLPAGMTSSIALDLNDGGVIVGAVSPSTSPEFSGRAAAWTPAGSGGYTVRLLGELPGHAISRATAVNIPGDIVGYSSNGTYRYPVLFTAPGGVLDLSATGVFDPVDLNDQRVLVDHSFTAKRLDLDTMIAEDLGVPAPPGGPRYVATRAEVINESGQVAGAAILATSTSCDRQGARYSDGVGWEIFSSCGPYNSVSDMNDLGDVIMRLNLAPYVRLEGAGMYRVEDLIVQDIGHWYVVNSFGLGINNARQIVVWANNQATNQSGAVLLTPEDVTAIADPPAGAPPAALALRAVPNPFQASTSIRFELAAAGAVTLSIHDTAGRLVRRLDAGTFRRAGSQAMVWNGLDEGRRPVASGIYTCRLDAGGTSRTARLVRLR